jgi:hypothetical protein
MIVKQQVNNIFGDDKQLLKFAFESVIESILNNPYRLQSFMEYSMSIVASASDSLCGAEYNGSHERQPNSYRQYYLSPNHNSDCIQLEYLKNIILNESDKLYNQKIDELKSQTICEAAVYRNNQLIDEKQSIKELPLFGSRDS